MKIDLVTDKSFAPYGKVLTGYDTSGLLQALKKMPVSEGVDYVPSEPSLEAEDIFTLFRDNAYGGMPIQLGVCKGYNTKLNCLEYHRDSELNIGLNDYILLVALESDIENGMLDTSKVKAFRAPAGLVVEMYATTLHYAPCHTNEKEGFCVCVVVPRGTNCEKPGITPLNPEDNMLWACNKWLLAHPESIEAKEGAHIGLTGKNIDIKDCF